MALKLTPQDLQSKNVALTMDVAGQLYEVFARTSAENVIIDKVTGETLKQRLATINSVIGNNGSVNAKIEAAVTEAVNKIVDSAPETFDTLREVAAFIEEHKSDFQALSALASVINTKVTALEANLDAEVTRAKAAEKANADALDAEIIRAKAAEKANADAIDAINAGLNADAEIGAVLTRTATGNAWDKVLKVIDVDTIEDLGTALASQVKPGQIGVVLLEDEPQGLVIDAQGQETEVSDMAEFLTTSTSTGTVVLNESVVLPKSTDGVAHITFKGTINLNGYTLEVEE